MVSMSEAELLTNLIIAFVDGVQWDKLSTTCSYSIMALHVLGKDETQVQFLLRAPQKCGIMDSSGVRSMDRTAFF